jgi:S1/P1 Nuclease
MLSIKSIRCLFSTLPLLILFLTVLPAQAFAWNGGGHMVSGAIAYSELKQKDPQALAKTIAILNENPEFDRLWKSQLTQVDPLLRDRVLFMLAAKWSDDIRDDDRYDHPNWHYINLPYKPDGEPASIQTREADPENILTAYAENLSVLQSDGSNSDKSVALCWIFHLIGDVHQPLHTTTLFTSKFPNGDRGGTRFYIKVKPDRSTISLHKFWDDLILGSTRFQSVSNRATELRLNPSYSRGALSELSETKFDNWGKPESFEIAKQVGYRNGALKGGTDRDNGEVLPSDYADTTKPVAQKRMVLAGYRLADLLSQLF